MTDTARPLSWAERLACLALLAIALISVTRWWTTLSMVAGGADSYGYVSESRLMLEGSLLQRPVEATWLPLERGQALGVSAPVGYVPSTAADAVVPVYPPGLPVLMAAATLAAGSNGPFFVAPIMGVIGLVLVFAIARLSFDTITACTAVAFVAWNPVYVAYARQPMSDVPASVFLLLSIWLILRRPSRPLLAGAAASLAFLTRPALLGGCAVLAFGVACRQGVRGALAYGGVLAAAVLMQMGVHWLLYGHPLQSGYGSPGTLFAWGHLPTNTAIYAVWIARTHGIVWLVALALGLALVHPRPLSLAAVALLVAVALPYLLYFEFDHWETLRFVLPGLIGLTIIAAAGTTQVMTRLKPLSVAAALVVGCAAAVALESSRWLERQGTWQTAVVEEKYPLVAQGVAESTPASAMVMAFQHSGSIRHYAGRFTLRWDVLPVDDLVPVVRALNARGVDVFAVFEGDEMERFHTRFRDVLDRVTLLPSGQARGVIVVEVRVR